MRKNKPIMAIMEQSRNVFFPGNYYELFRRGIILVSIYAYNLGVIVKSMVFKSMLIFYIIMYNSSKPPVYKGQYE